MKENGLALIGVLILMALLNLLSIAIWVSAKNAQLIAITEVHGMAASAEATAATLLSALTIAPQSKRFCVSAGKRMGKVEISRLACGSTDYNSADLTAFAAIDGSRPPSNSVLPPFDFNAIFEKRKDCDRSLILSAHDFGAGKPVSQGSAHSDYTCLNPDLPKEGLVLFSNVELNTPAILAEDVLAYTLATAGYLDVSSTLTFSRPLLVIAGGDMQIKELKTQKAVSLTLVSATGHIKVEKLAGNPPLRVIAANGYEIPANANLQLNSLLPPVKEREIIGFVRN